MLVLTSQTDIRGAKVATGGKSVSISDVCVSQVQCISSSSSKDYILLERKENSLHVSLIVA